MRAARWAQRGFVRDSILEQNGDATEGAGKAVVAMHRRTLFSRERCLAGWEFAPTLRIANAQSKRWPLD